MLPSTRELQPIVEMQASLEARAICRLDAWLAMMMKVVQNVKKMRNKNDTDVGDELLQQHQAIQGKQQTNNAEEIPIQNLYQLP